MRGVARALLLVFEKFTPAYLFQIALEIMWLPILISSTHYHQYLWLFYLINCSWVKLPLWIYCTSKIGPIMHCHVLGSVDLDSVKRLEKDLSSNSFLIQMWTSVKQDHTLAMLRVSVLMFLAPTLANVYQATRATEKANVKVHISKI